MSTNQVINPYEYFMDFNQGRPIFNGQIFVGLVGTDPEVQENQKDVTFSDACDCPEEAVIMQPIRTSSGGVPIYNGSPIRLFVEGAYSLKVNDRNGVQVYYSPDVTKGGPLTDSTGVTTVDTIALLRVFEPDTDGQQISLLGHTLPGVGGGELYYDASDTTSLDNNGTIIVTTGGKRWKRTDIGKVFGSWFGMDLTGSTDDSLLMQSAVDTGLPVYLEVGSYQFANITPPNENDKLLIFGDSSNKTIVSGPFGFSGYIFNTTSGYDIRGLTILGGTVDGQYAIGADATGQTGGSTYLFDVRMFNFEQCVRFGSEYEHPLGLEYDRVYCQNFTVAGINLGGTSGGAASGESAWSLPNVIVTNPDTAPVEYAETTQNNVPSTSQDTISWFGDSPEFGYLVLRSLDNSTNWQICPNWVSSNYTAESFIADKEAGETWFYKVIRMTIGINVRRGKVVNFGAAQTEYTGIGIRLDEIQAFNINSSYYEIRQATQFRGGFAGVFAAASIGQIGSGWGEYLGYNVFVYGNADVSVSSIRSSNGIIAVIGNTGATTQSVTYENITQGNTPKLYSSPKNDAYDFNYDGTQYTTDKNVRKISHVTESRIEVQRRGITKGAFIASSSGSTLEVNSLDLRLNSKNMTPVVSNDIGLTLLTDSIATDFLEIATIGSSGSASVRLLYKIRAIDESLVSRQSESGWLDVDILNTESDTPTGSVQGSSMNQIINAGTLSTLFSVSSNANLLTVSCNANSSLTLGSIRLEITPISVIGNIDSITQL